MSDTAADVIIIGSGPAGISAAWPLVRAGVRVLMIDASEAALPTPPRRESLAEWRADARRWRAELGAAGAIVAGEASPKFTTPLAQATLAGFDGAARLSASNYVSVGSLAAGGLSQIWGALAARLDEADLLAFGPARAGLEGGYRSVAERIGLDRHEAPADPRLTAPAATLAARHRGCDDGLRLVRAPNAVLSAPLDGREACTACGLCLHGCSRGSIYQSASELPALRRFANFSYRAGIVVERIAGAGGLQIVIGRSGRDEVRLRAPHLILAAGTVMTTSLALRRIGHVGRPVRLLSNPVGGMAFVVPSLIGAALPERSFGLGQLFYSLAAAPGIDAAGVFYGADTLPLAAIADRLPLTRPAALRTARALAPALLLATAYLPGALSANLITVDEDRAGGRIRIEGAHAAGSDALLRGAMRKLGRHARRRGAWALPGSISLLAPGADAHPAGTLPMGGAGSAATDWSGELVGAPGVYVADGAALPALSAKHPTLTIMANADRVAGALAQRLTAATPVAHVG